jgi:serine/threonine-protein kinase
MSSEKYRVVKRLESGGMAEVFIGEAVSVQGFRKRVAIKRVLPHLAEQSAFMGMFLDEARLGARLNHANIVSVTDIGAADNTYFIVMEYIDGANLKTLMQSFRRAGKRFPLKEASYIAMAACRALSYAHELKDDDGNHIGVVHRDVSPPNILLSRRGETKMTDFGLAKATTQLEKTDPGVVKGKFSYLSPEAAMGKEVDARADVFSLGIVLWEMLAGRRLFLGDSDFQTVKLVQSAEVPRLSRLNPTVDEEFEALLDRALARERKNRFATAEAFGDALADYLFNHRLKVTSYDIAALVNEALEKHDQGTGSRDHSIIDRLIQEELLRFTSLDDSEKTEGTPKPGVNPAPQMGAKPLDAAAFEEPGNWFEDESGLLKGEAAKDTGKPESVRPGGLADALENSSAAIQVPIVDKFDSSPAVRNQKILFAGLIIVVVGLTAFLVLSRF